MTTLGETIFWKKENGQLTNSSDTWDDTELIKAYDKAISDLKNGDSQKPPKNNSKQTKKKKKESNALWKAGGECLAVFSDDGLYYEATILSVDHRKKTVEVVFDYYENEEEVKMEDLLPIEDKAQMEVVTNSVNDIPYDDENPSSDSFDDNKDNFNGHMNWHISDLCYVKNKKGSYEKAVLNSFKSSDLCYVTIIKSNKKKEVKTSQLCSYVPSTEKKRTTKNSTNCCNCTSNNDFQNGFSGSIPPPPLPPHLPSTFLSSPSRLPNHSFLNAFTPHQYPDHCNGMGNDPNIPKCPPLPKFCQEVIAGDEEALANMLMSWYLSGYHTGYYQGSKKISNGGIGEHGRTRRGNKTLV